jgi:hypothetical protein
MIAVGTDGVSWDALPMTAAEGPVGEGAVGVAVEHAAAAKEHPSHTRIAHLVARGLPVPARRAKAIRLF